ncbi:hypothetical protein J14TS2_13180 [Bacillus sp. J14TS2]|uniref:helix-turn-helix domain-containing protein n=1 Tax=Bacillus sp. J14TS2 TaxID=2807188 RepID=UPI001B28E787|nr:helix-turn-helix domain-containing protein [Bacillus sp. J14TS2]GIN70843.1 hypothetical protein J14TS2_13180 [Bacillus sp. J14TS2]
MFKWSKKKPRLLYKYLFSYLLVFMLPFITISMILYHLSVGNLKREIIQSNTDKINQIGDITDSRLVELNHLATRISNDQRLTPYMLTQPYLDKQAITEIVKYKMNNTFIDELFINFHETKDFVYSSRGVSTFQTFVRNNYQVQPQSIEDLSKGLLVQSDPMLQVINTISINGNNQRVIAYSYPMPIDSSIPIGTVTFFIKETSLSNLIKNTLGKYDGASFIFDDEFNLLVSNKNGIQMDLDFVKEVSSKKTGISNEDFENDNYSFSIIRSQTSNWTFVTVMPTEQFYGKMTSLKQSIFVILFILAAAGMIIVCFLSVKHYKPIEKLVHSLRNKEQSGQNLAGKNEIELIRTKIESIYEDSEHLKRKIVIHKPFVRAQFLSNLLKGEMNNVQEITTLANDLKVFLRGDSFFVIALSYKGKIKRQEAFCYWEKLVKLIDHVSYQDCTGYGVELVHDYTATLIVSNRENSADLNDNRQLFVHHLIKVLKEYRLMMPVIGVGGIYKGAHKINRSFIEASASTENSLLGYANKVIFFEDLSIENKETIWFPEESRLKFIQSLKQGDPVVAKEILVEILSSLVQKNTSNHILKCTCFDIINTILKTTSELDILHHTEAVKELSEFQSLAQMKENANISIDRICLEVEKRKESHNYQLRDNIMEYIQKQYKHHDLSLEGIADHFQISSTYLSKFIREQTGITFTQFVWELRMQECKDQLFHTNRTIKEIVLDIGYFDVSNFIRKFRKEEGITPSQYRKSYQQNIDEKEVL